MAQVSHCVRRAITTLFIDNPPIQALSSSVIEELHRHLEVLENEQSTEAVILMGKNGIFSAGADINEFNQMRFGNSNELELSDLISRLDAFKKPIVAFIQRYAFGGGLEVALGCHYRLAEKGSKVGLPEVKIGLIPGAQGTQRLPRLIGPRRAMEMTVWGNPISADKALEYGVIDKVIHPGPSDVMEAVYEFVESVKGMPIPPNRRLSQCVVNIPHDDSIEDIVADTRRTMGKQMQGAVAPLYALRAVKAALKSRTFEIGVQREKELFTDVFSSGQSQALQYAFQASRRAMKLPKEATSAVPLRVSKVGVIGGGVMGQGIVATFLASGFSVHLLERDQKSADIAEKAIRKLIDGAVALGRVRKKGELRVTTKPEEALSNCDLVVEAVWEDMELKKKIFAMMDEHCPKQCLLCSNTSTLDIDQIAGATSRPEQVIGSHFFIPAYYMRPVEIVKGAKTSPQTLATLHSLVRAIGKVPFTVGNCYGFVGNRMILSVFFEAIGCLLDGMSPYEIDEAMESFGMTIGPFRTLDLVGIDLMSSIVKNAASEIFSNEDFVWKFVELLNRLIRLGRLGRKSGAGIYKYDHPGAKISHPDPDIEKIIEPFRHPEGVLPPKYDSKEVTHQEIVDRCVFVQINEGFKILEEGIVNNPETVDAMMLQAYGWPQILGGPLYFATTIGLNNVLAKVEQRHAETGHNFLKPSELLKKLVSMKETPTMIQWARFGKL